jgi:F0F1-type ATP synthase membrane subunit b/b'
MIIDLWPLSIKIDVLIVQIINVAILLYIFKKLFGKTLEQEIAKRRELTRKLQSAEVEYNAVIAQATHEKEVMLAEATEHKKHLLVEATALAQKQRESILTEANTQANRIMQKAEQEAAVLRHDLEKNRENSIKQTAGMIVKNIFKKDVSLQQEYVDMLIKEASSSRT